MSSCPCVGSVCGRALQGAMVVEWTAAGGQQAWGRRWVAGAVRDVGKIGLIQLQAYRTPVGVVVEVQVGQASVARADEWGPGWLRCSR